MSPEDDEHAQRVAWSVLGLPERERGMELEGAIGASVGRLQADDPEITPHELAVRAEALVDRVLLLMHGLMEDGRGGTEGSA